MIPLIVIAGPTACGKTALSIKLAKKIGGEIISADSMQVYRRMDIGTAKVTKEEMDGVTHHLIDIMEPTEEWNVMLFTQLAKEAIEDIHRRGKVPILAGGTGFYIRALAFEAEFEEEETDDGLRLELEKLSTEELTRQLREIDPVSAETIEPNNRKRVIRAIEYFRHTGEKISDLNARLKEKPSPYDLRYLVLERPREELYARIDQRVDLMLEQGLVDEVLALYREGLREDMVSMKGLGYKEILAYLRGKCTLEEAVRILKRDTRHFAKRQMTWWRRERNVRFIQVSPEETLLDRVLQEIGEI